MLRRIYNPENKIRNDAIKEALPNGKATLLAKKASAQAATSVPVLRGLVADLYEIVEPLLDKHKAI